jgi:hypothetical protein
MHTRDPSTVGSDTLTIPVLLVTIATNSRKASVGRIAANSRKASVGGLATNSRKASVLSNSFYSIDVFIEHARQQR